MNQERLLHELELVAARYRHLRLWQALAAAWLLAAACGGLLLWLRWSTGAAVPFAWPNLVAAAFILAGGSAVVALASARRLKWIAQRIELAYPELGTCLLAAIEQRPDLPDGRFGYLQSSVIREALTHADRHNWRQRVVPASRLWIAALTNAASLVVLLLVLAGLASHAVGPAAASSGGNPSLEGGVDGLSVSIEPGDTEVERGTSLLVLARFKGVPPAQATLIYTTSGGEESRLAMSRSLDDPVFGGRIPTVDAPLDYRVELSSTLGADSAAGSEANSASAVPAYLSDTFHVEVFEYPELRRADARLAYPRYTGLEERLVQDVRTVSVVEGTEVTLLCYLNKPVASARFVDKDGLPLALAARSSEQACYEATFNAEKSRRLKLELVDDRGRKNVKQAEIAINVHPNRPPTLKPTFPARDMAVSPLEEMDVKATVWDDYGLARFGLTYSMAGGEPVDVVLGERSAAKERHALAHTIRFEDLAVEPDQLLSYHFWAEDHAAGGSIRRTLSDMYFAEVRPFEEIFRQGQQPPGGQQQQQQGQGQNAQQADQLAELQKEIINATWKVIRRESSEKLSDSFGSDVELVQLSQASAIEQATALAGRLQDSQSQEHVEDVLQAMQQALTQLKAAREGPTREPLSPALAAEQAAYQALLKLRAREHSVVRAQQQQQQQSSSSRNSSSRAQQQLEQLELSNEQNRYETQRTAQSLQEEDQAQREERQVLNRLKELARRQHDLNERLKELQTALEEAQTEEEREDIRRQLARLQEEQRQILEDTDELQSRMDQPENQERMAEERQQLEEARDNVRRASEALEQQQVTQAAAAGSRAEREFDELRNEFRRRASSRFREEARELRAAAREMDEREQGLAQRMAEAGGQETGDREQESGVRSQESGDRKAKSLSEGVDRQQLATELGEQRQRLAELEQRMRQTIDEAEPTEPLLAEKLYDAARGIQDRGIDRALDTTQRSLRQGLLNDAQRLEEQARRGIGELREGIEQAAESVLGDETEALRRARQQLDNLAEELNDEIARNSPENAVEQGQRRPGSQQSDRQQPGEGRPGEQRQENAGPENGADRQTGGQQQEEQRQDGDQQGGQRQPGERQNQRGQGQPGERQESGDQERQNQRGQQPSGQQPGDQQPGGQQPGEQQPGQQQGQGSPQGGRPGEQRDQEGQPNRPGEQGQPGERNQQDSERGQPGERNQPGQPGERRGPAGARRLSDSSQRGSAGPFNDSSEGFMNPLTGDDFLNWSDRLRDVEEMVDDPELRAEAARIRERARAVRAEFRRHSAEPQWDLVRAQVAEPLGELRDRVVEELLRRASRQALVPLDRDPVPPKYSERTRRYYERLGAGALGSDGNAGSAP